MKPSHLFFNSAIGSQKPETIVNRQNPCPFCDVDSLTGIIEKEDSIIWLENKYPVLQNAYQTVIIETDQCQSELSEYPKEHLYKLFSFVTTRWLQMIESKKYESVLFFKNHGPMSGGSLRHPHMQIIGLKTFDTSSNITDAHFEGISIQQNKDVEFNLSTKPRMGFFEFNIVTSNIEEHNKEVADYIQAATHYLLNHFHRSCTSYNLFFYQLDDGRSACKVIPRFATSPLFVGYGIPQVSNKIEEIAKQVHSLYFSK
ncbi:DUF4931 domain-containing protein [Priestia flexa]|uniref:Galactose-1-phosphate uridylyltransferase n=1 Tax=Priestia flexa TaxID=86664 RepID=A0A8I1MHQ8_9BACI|nr:DUF4931 domain-containing protein [Priestia flexa]AQX55437.1 DUF4931 domain-containing protein [Priestia flexa]MBN8252556.1 DUF4931 domain-containing protein [Priestia flexa]MBN8434025.1 DUF4931 domain-containing protein [Priestia flexa]MCA0966558.1 DUF4931 domain-containing protein [Priestia flexa]MCA1201624.1 DUF4931 domain-containing protein [Priestia flexa]